MIGRSFRWFIVAVPFEDVFVGLFVYPIHNKQGDDVPCSAAEFRKLPSTESGQRGYLNLTFPSSKTITRNSLNRSFLSTRSVPLSGEGAAGGSKEQPREHPGSARSLPHHRRRETERLCPHAAVSVWCVCGIRKEQLRRIVVLNAKRCASDGVFEI